MVDWHANSWKSFEQRQLPTYDPNKLREVTDELELVEATVADEPEIMTLRERIADAQQGRAFLIQGGDCAETFAEYHPHKVRDQVFTLLTLADIIEQARHIPVIPVARIAGQFAKPRSSDTETQHDETLPVYRGDIVNAHEFHPDARRADPQRMMRAYEQSIGTALLMNGLALHTGRTVYTSHEALLLPYEQALLRRRGFHAKDFASTGHMLWIGERTRFEGSAHVEFCRGISNPIGVKVGPVMAENPDELIRLLDKCNPLHETGKMVVICRMGSAKVRAALPKVIEAVKASGHPVLWSCDPMHGNTVSVGDFKTRPMAFILSEVNDFFEVCRSCNVFPGAIHLEMTGQPVTECVGADVSEGSLYLRYHSHCDPRLNAAQAQDVAILVAALLGS